MTAFRLGLHRVQDLSLLHIVGLAAVVASGLAGCDTPPTTTTPHGFSITITTPVSDIYHGTQGTFTVNVTRTSGFSGAVAVTGGGSTSTGGTGGITVASITIPSGATTGVMTIVVPSTTPAGLVLLHIEGTGTGFAAETGDATFHVLAGGTFAIGNPTGDAAVNPGSTMHGTMKVSRTQYTQPVTLTVGASRPSASFTTTLTPATTTDNSVDNVIAVSVAVGADVPAGLYFIPINGKGDGAPDQSHDFPVFVRVPSYDMAVAPPPAAINVGTSGTAAVTLTRDLAFTTAVSVTGAGTNGITVTPVSIPGSATQAALQINVPATTAPGPYTLVVTGSASGQIDKTVSVPILVGGYSFNVLTSPLNVVAGSSAQDTANIVRVNFTGTIAVTATSDPGITVTANPASVSGNQTTLTVSVLNSVAPGTYTVALQGVSPGIANKAGSLTVVVSAAPTGTNTTWTFCAVTSLPIFVAVQDGSAAWTKITSTTSAYTFQVSSTKGGIAYVLYTGGVYELHVFYGTQSELQTQGASLCPNTGAVKSVSGSVTNTGTAATAYVSLGSAFTYLSLPTSTFGLTNVPPGALDLVGATVTGGSPPSAIRMALRRNVTAANASTMAALDFTGTESFAPQTAALVLGNTQGQQVDFDEYLHTSNDLLSLYYSDFSAYAATSRTLFGVPAANQTAGDLHFLSALATSNTSGTGAVPFRTQGVFFGAVAAKTLTFGSALTTPTVSKVTAVPAVVLRATLTTQAEYNKLYQADYDQISTKGEFATVQMTGAYAAGAGSVNVDLPNLSALPSWFSFYGLIAGTPVAWRVTASSWSTAGGITFPQFIDGATFTSATVQGNITP